MPAINFKQQFAHDVELGIKKQTVRAKRKRVFEVGDKLYLLTGMRTSQCRRLRSTQADEVESIFIDTNNTILLGNKVLSFDEAEQFAKQDGFDSLKAFMAFFRNTHGLPFDGQVIRWL